MSSINSIVKEFETFTNDANEAGNELLYDSDCIHEDIFSLTMDVTNKEIDLLKNALESLKNKEKKFIISLSPQISTNLQAYNKAKELDILYKWPNSTILHGTYLNKTVAYPDFSNPKVNDWFKNYFVEMKNTFGMKTLDGIVLRSNWPANENNNSIISNKNNEFKYLSKELQIAMSNTIPWNAESDKRKHISLHNNYGQHHIQAVNTTNPITENMYLLSASYSDNTMYGSHVQNVDASWMDLKNMLTRTLSNSLFGSIIDSFPVCGSTKYYNEALCLRWYQTAITLPVFRISSDFPRRHPLSVKSEYFKQLAIKSIDIRYKLLPYYYTVLCEKLPLVRPMFFNYPLDEQTYKLDEQYMIGNSMLVAQPMTYTSSLNVYLPENPDVWFAFSDGTKYISGFHNITVVETDIIMFIPAGHIISYTAFDNKTATNSEQLRKQPLSLLIALNCENPECKASGLWCINEATCLNFEATKNKLVISNVQALNKILCDPNKEKIATSIITSIRLYQENKKPVNSNVACDLCSYVNDIIEINL